MTEVSKVSGHCLVALQAILTAHNCLEMIAKTGSVWVHIPIWVALTGEWLLSQIVDRNRLVVASDKGKWLQASVWAC